MIDDNAVDRAIDDAARHMTAGEPSASFRVQVVARLDDGGRRWRTSLWAWSSAVAIVMLLIGVAISLRPETPSPRGEHARGDIALSLPSRPSGTDISNPQIASTAPPRPSGRAARDGAQQLEPSAIASRVPGELLPLAERSIAIDPIALEPLPPHESIVPEPLPSIAPIAASPLGQGEEK